MMLRNCIFTVFILGICTFSLVGCDHSKNQEEVIVTINHDKVYKSEYMLYLMSAKDRFEELAGKDVWSIEDFSGGKTAEEVAKSGALDNLIRDKIIITKAKDLSVSLSDEVNKTKQKKATGYYEQNKDRFEVLKITKDLVVKVVLNQQLAYEVQNAVMNNENNAPGDDEVMNRMRQNDLYNQLTGQDLNAGLQGVLLQYVFVKLSDVDQNGQIVPLSEEERSLATATVEEAYTEAINGMDFREVIMKYSQETTKETTNGEFVLTIYTDENGNSYYFLPDYNKDSELSGSLLSDDELKAVVQDMEKGEISEIATTAYGFYFFRYLEDIELTEEQLVNFNESFITLEEKLRQQAIRDIKDEAFEVIFNNWKDEATIETDQNIYNTIKIFE